MPVYSALFGSAFTINTNSSGGVRDPEVAALSDGGFVAAWVSTTGLDGQQDGVFGQRFDAAGIAVGAEFQINTLSNSNQNTPHITALADGGFAVVYSSFGLDDSLIGIGLQRYSATGSLVGEETLANAFTTSVQQLPVITQLAGGSLMALWESYTRDGDSYGIAGRVLPLSGDPTAEEFIVNSYATGSQTLADIAALPTGGFVAVWQSTDQDGSSDGVYGQIFGASATPVGAEFAVNTSTFSAQDRASVAALQDGGFVIAWESGQNFIGASDVYARVYNADGSARTAEMFVSEGPTGFEYMPDALGLSDGSFLLSWRSGGAATDFVTYPGGHYAQRFAADGTALADAFVVTTDSASTPAQMRLSELSNGDVIAVWNSAGSGSNIATIQGQRLFTAGEIEGSSGNDLLTGAHLGDRILGLAGNDTLMGLEGIDTLIGGEGDDFLFGGNSETDLRDLLYGGAGNDSLDGGYGNDELRGDGGNDTIVGGFGVDDIFGGDGDDELTGQAWSDLIFGGAGDDFINGGFGYDRVNGGAGADRFFHIGDIGHGSDWIQDYVATDGDLLHYGGTATRDQFQVNLTETANAGEVGVEEAFVIYRPTGQILWALVDGGGQAEINLLLSGVTYDLMG